MIVLIIHVFLLKEILIFFIFIDKMNLYLCLKELLKISHFYLV